MFFDRQILPKLNYLKASSDLTLTLLEANLLLLMNFEGSILGSSRKALLLRII